MVTYLHAFVIMAWLRERRLVRLSTLTAGSRKREKLRERQVLELTVSAGEGWSRAWGGGSSSGLPPLTLVLERFSLYVWLSDNMIDTLAPSNTVSCQVGPLPAVNVTGLERLLQVVFEALLLLLFPLPTVTTPNTTDMRFIDSKTSSMKWYCIFLFFLFPLLWTEKLKWQKKSSISHK